MKTRRSWWIGLIVAGIAAVAALIYFAPVRFPVKEIQVIDASGKPVGDAIVKPIGLRAGGPYSANWYGWEGAPAKPVRTDKQGLALLPYPAFVFERVETSIIIVTIDHSDFVVQQVELPVPPLAPFGGPLGAWERFLQDHFQHRGGALTSKPVVLLKGATVEIIARTNVTGPIGGRVCVIGSQFASDGMWTDPGPEVAVTHRLASGSHQIQLAQRDSKGVIWFSSVKTINVAAGETNELVVDLTRGTTLSGQIEPAVPRPIANGRVILNIAPLGVPFSSTPPQWHAWSTVRPDGSFTVSNLPPGNLEIIALCEGYISTNGPGKYHFHYPQSYLLGSKGLSITVGMEHTATLIVQAVDDGDHPVKDAAVSLWPNVRYGEWSAVILGSDDYNTIDQLLGNAPQRRGSPFTAKTDATGRAVIPNLPVEANELSIEHPEWVLPPANTGIGWQSRDYRISLQRGQTTSVTIHLERRKASTIVQY